MSGRGSDEVPGRRDRSWPIFLLTPDDPLVCDRTAGYIVELLWLGKDRLCEENPTTFVVEDNT